MKTIIILLFGVALLLYVGDIAINFKPFSVSLPAWRNTLAFLFVTLGMYFYTSHSSIKARETVFNEINSYYKHNPTPVESNNEKIDTTICRKEQ